MSFVILGLLLCGYMILIFLFTRHMRKTMRMDHGSLPGKKVMWLRMYNVLDRNFITRQGLRKSYNFVSSLAVFDLIDNKTYAVKDCLSVYVKSLTLFLLVAVIFRNIFLCLGVVLFVYAYLFHKVDQKYKRITIRMKEQESSFYSQLMVKYGVLGSVPDAIADCTPGPLISNQVSKLYNALLSPDRETALNEFRASCPSKTMQTLSGVCDSIDMKGDSESIHDESDFQRAISMLTEDVNLEIQRLTMMQSKFKPLYNQPLLGVILIPPIYFFYPSLFESSGYYFSSFLGSILIIITLLLAIVCFKMLEIVTGDTAIVYDDITNTDKMLYQNHAYRRFVHYCKPTKMSRLSKKLLLLKKSMSRMNLDYLYCRKVFYLIAIAVVSFVFLTCSMAIAKSDSVSNYYTSDMAGSDEVLRGVITIEDMVDKDMEFLQAGDFSEEAMGAYVDSYIARDTYRSGEISRIKTKADLYTSSAINPFNILLSLLLGVIGFWVPDLQLAFRAWLIAKEAEDDVLQIQTIISIIMNTSVDTLSILGWIAEQSRVFRPLFVDAEYSYPMSPDNTIATLRQKAGTDELRAIIDKLELTAGKLPVNVAFADLINRRGHLLALRRQRQIDDMNNKYRIASNMVRVPFYGMMFSVLAMPTCYVLYSTAMGMLEQLGQL